MKAKKYLLLVILIAIPNSLAMYTNYNSDYSFQEAESADISSDELRRDIEEIEDPELRDSFHRQLDSQERLWGIEKKLGIFRIICIFGVIILGLFAIREHNKKKMVEKIQEKEAYRQMVANELDKKNKTTSKLETCDNCERTIGKLEQAYVFSGNVVCAECSERLKANPENEQKQ